MNFNDFYKLDNITMNIANECPLRCSYCYANKIKGLMNKELAEKILDKCYKNHLENGSNKKFNVSFYGGEPLINWDCLKHCLEYSEKNNYDISFGVTTNLVILTDEMIEYFKKFNVKILVSIDGNKEIHDKNRCNSYDKVIENIHKLFNNGLKENITPRMTVTPECCKNLWDNIKSILDLGFNNVETVPVTDMIWSEEDYEAFEDNLSEVWDNVLESYYADNPYKIKFVEDYIRKDLIIGNTFQKEPCNAGSCYDCSVGVNGEIMPCHQRHLIPNNYNNVLIGNINSDEIKENKFKNFSIKSNCYDCHNCCAYPVCNGGCPSENLTQNGDANIMNVTQCNIQIILYRIAIIKIGKLMTIKNLPPYLENVVRNNIILDLISKNFFGNIDEIMDMIKFMGDNMFPNVMSTVKEVIHNTRVALDK